MIEGANQSVFALPHFTTSNKAQRSHILKITPLKIFEHMQNTSFHFLTITEYQEIGPNRIVEVLIILFNDRVLTPSLPLELLIQIDNCTCKTRTFFSCLTLHASRNGTAY